MIRVNSTNNGTYSISITSDLASFNFSESASSVVKLNLTTTNPNNGSEKSYIYQSSGDDVDEFQISNSLQINSTTGNLIAEKN